MQILYPILLIIHLLSAIIFLGYIFFDVVIFPIVKKILGQEISDKVSEAILVKGTKIMPLCILGLFITGAGMLSHYIGGDMGAFQTNFQKLLLLKVLLALVVITMVIFSIFCRFIFKIRNPIGKFVHPTVLVLGFFIVILAKLMYFV